MNTVTFKIEGMRCDGCAETIQSLLGRNAGVQKARASFKDGEARVLYDSDAVTEEQLVAVIENSGYRVSNRNRG
ncbi:MAG: heavy-metal-associated domain-containing protein [Deltaproteobacteria bacterium]|jgi:copper chaperone CopZ|nr:heavy-metal-associated domain-containing protein [Deltaproteobacteria bacterium]MDZ4346745.1 heavy-metal-associated domain-containing protein [Candidatus Binatia bacterium]